MEKNVFGEDTLVLSSPSEYVSESKVIGKKKIIVKNSFVDGVLILTEYDRYTELYDLEEIRVEGEGMFHSSDDGRMVFRCFEIGDMDLAYAICWEENVIIPDNVRGILDNVFHGCDFRSVKFPETLEYIGGEAFSKCGCLKSVKLCSHNTEIDFRAFWCCDSLESIDLNGVTKIGDLAFSECQNLTDVKLYEGLTEISYSAFCDCPKLEKIDIPSSVKELGQLSLGDVKDVYLKGKEFPHGIFEAAAAYWDSPSSMHVHIGNTLVIIPRSCDLSKLDMAEQYLKESDLEKEKTIVLYQIAERPEDSQNIALEGYPKTEDPEMGKFLRKSFPDMLRRTKTEEEFLELFSKFRDVGLLTIGLAQKALAVAQEKDWPQTISYLSELINEHTKKYNHECVDKFQL